MDLVIPKNLMGSAGESSGAAIQHTGREISRAGSAMAGFFDNIQKNIDYNNTVGVKNDYELRAMDYSQKFWAKEDGSRPDAVDRYKEGLTEINREYSSKAYGFGDRVGNFFEKYSQVRTAELEQAGQRTYYRKMIDKSQQMDLAETDLMTKQAINSGEINFAMAERDTALESRRGIYGDNVDGMKVAHKALMAENFIKGRLANPSMAPAMIQAMNDPAYKANLFQYIPAGKVDEIEKLMASGQRATAEREGINIGVEVFKSDSTGSLEAMTDAVRARKLDQETEKAAVTQIKELWHERKIDGETKKNIAIETVNKILVPIALKRNGLNRPNDLTPEQWEYLNDNAPEYAAKLQDNMRRELDYQTRQNRAETRAYAQEKRLQQSENESAILISEDFPTRDLKRDLAAGDISPTQYTKLSKAQTQLDPIKRDSVKAALNKVNTGSGLAKALNVKTKNDEAIWKLKYSNIVKAWAYNHSDDPNFDQKLGEFVEKRVLSEMVTSWFATDENDRLDKYQKAKNESGDIPYKYRNTSPTFTGGVKKQYSQEDLDYTAKKHGITIDEVKKRLGVE